MNGAKWKKLSNSVLASLKDQRSTILLANNSVLLAIEFIFQWGVEAFEVFLRSSGLPDAVNSWDPYSLLKCILKIWLLCKILLKKKDVVVRLFNFVLVIAQKQLSH